MSPRTETLAISASTLARLEAQLDALETILRGAIPEALDRKPEPTKWSARENIAHLTRYQQVFSERIDLILKTDTPQLLRYRTEDDPEWPAWRDLPIEELMQRMSASRSQLIARARGLTAEQLARTGVHSRFGTMSLAFWLEFFLIHEGHHIYVVLQLARRV